MFYLLKDSSKKIQSRLGDPFVNICLTYAASIENIQTFKDLFKCLAKSWPIFLVLQILTITLRHFLRWEILYLILSWNIFKLSRLMLAFYFHNWLPKWLFQNFLSICSRGETITYLIRLKCLVSKFDRKFRKLIFSNTFPVLLILLSLSSMSQRLACLVDFLLTMTCKDVRGDVKLQVVLIFMCICQCLSRPLSIWTYH